MKKVILGGLCLASMLCACNSVQKSGAYTVEGELNDSLSNGKMIYILRYDDGKFIDSTLVEGNKFTFTGKVDTAVLCRIDVTHEQFANFILEDGKIKVDFDNYNNPSGTPMNEKMAVVAAKEDSIYEFYNKKVDQIREQYPDQKEYREAMTKHVDVIKEVFAKEGLELLKLHNNDAVGEFIIRTSFMPDKTEQQEVALNSLGAWLKSRNTAQQMITRLEGVKNTAEGKPFVDIKGKDAEGKDVALSDFVGKGNYVLMDMWASWCGPCRGEIPNLAKLHNQFKDKGLTVLGVFVWDKEENLKKSMAEEKVTWPQIFDSEEKATNLYGVRGIPQIILFAPDGTIAHRNLRGENMIETVSELMNKK